MSQSPLSEKSKIILRLIAQGHNYEQILARHSSYTYMDIFNAAKEALNEPRASRSASNQERIAKIKEKYPRAYEAWEHDEESKLKLLHAEGKTIAQICTILERQPGAIEARLKKLGLIEE